MKISAQLQSDFEKWRDKTLDCNPNFASTQKEILDLIDLYWTDKYRDNSQDDLGFEKPFYNIVENPTQVAAKMVDFDTKDIKIKAAKGSSYYPAWLFEKDLKFWMKDKQFGKLLNKIVYDLPKYGHILLKKVGDNVKIVPIQNIINRPGAKSIMDSDFIIEKHIYTPQQLREKDWDNIEKAIEKYAQKGKIAVYERLGPIKGHRNNYFIVAGTPTKIGDVVLFSDKKDRKKVYKELKWENIPGRALGRGQVEKLFQAQIQTNKVAYYKTHGLHWTSKHLFQTRDDAIDQNLLRDVSDGQVLIANHEISPVPMEERNLHAYREEEERWDNLVYKRTFAYPEMAGKRPAAGTPLGTSVLQTRMAGGFFDLKREDIGMFIKELLYEWVIPNFKKKRKLEHRLPLSEFDEGELDKLRGLVLENKTRQAFIDHISRTGYIPSRRERELMKSLVKKRVEKERDIKIPAKYYNNLKYKIDVIITGEKLDVASRLTTLQTVLQILGANPTILQDKNTRKVFFKLLDLAGFSPTDFEQEPKDLEQVVREAPTRARRGGGMPRIRPKTTPETAPATQRL